MPCIKQFIDHRLIPTYMGNSINGDYMEFADTVNPHVHGELILMRDTDEIMRG